ncbi:MAG: hypothetical protein IJ864_00225 [Alphaproteobacteria bacterium]|nr:hypothetical protein [Alphaproteobacteria bacterium]
MTLSAGIGLGLSLASKLLKSDNESRGAKQKAATYQQQATVYRQNARNMRRLGAMNEDIQRAHNRRELAQNVASAAEAGMAESPTALSALATTAAQMEQNVLNLRRQNENEAENLDYQARLAQANARQMRKKSHNVFRSALISGIGSTFQAFDALR